MASDKSTPCYDATMGADIFFNKEAAMPAKTGAQYIANLQANPAEVWLRGERVADVAAHPALAGALGRWLRFMICNIGRSCGRL